MKKHLFQSVTSVAAAVLAVFFSSASMAAKPPGNGTSNWSRATVISPSLLPDPTRGSQLNDLAVNASGLTLAAWEQYNYAAGGPYIIGAAVQAGGRWNAPFTVSGTVRFATNPRVAVGADSTMAVSWVHEDASFTQQEMQVAVKSPMASTWTITTLASGPIPPSSSNGFVPIGIDAVGNVTAAWIFWDGVRNVVQTATLPNGGA